MTIYASKIERLRCMHEASFGNDGSGTLGNYKEVPAREGTIELVLNEPLESPMHVQQRVDGHPTRVHMPRSATLTFECNAQTFTTKATSTVAATQSWLGILLESYLGGKHLMTGTTINDAAADQNDWDGAVVTTLRPGAAVGLATGTGGTLEVREIKSKSGSNIVLKHNTTGSPSNGSTVYGAATYFANPRTDGSEFKSLGFVAESYVTTDKWVLLGGAVTACELKTEPGAIPTLKFTITFADWQAADGSDAAANLTGAIVGEATYINASTIVMADSGLYYGVVGDSSAPDAAAASAINWAPAVTYAAVRTPGGTNNIVQYVRVHVSPVLSGDFVVPYEDQNWRTSLESNDSVSLWLQIGSAPTTGAIVISAPNVQIVDVQRVDVDGISCQKVSWVARHDTDTTAESSYEGLAQSAFRIHML